MKHTFFKYSFCLFIISGFSLTLAAQKVSDRSFTSELQKLREKQEARKKMLQQTQQGGESTNTTATKSTMTETNQQPAIKPSSQPMRIPVRSKKQ